MTLLIGFSGKIKSGKDTCCNFLVRNAPELFPGKTIKKYSFGTQLKIFCRDFFNVPERNLWGTGEDKNELIHIKWQDLPNYRTILEYARWKGYEKPVGRLRARDLMQHIGDSFRKIYPQVWVNLLNKDIRPDNPDIALICDLRYETDAEYVHTYSGKIIRLTREVKPLSEHISETALDKYKHFDCIIDNQGISVADTYEKLVSFVTSLQV